MNKVKMVSLPGELFDVFTLREETKPTFRDIHDKDRYYNSSNRNVLRPIVSDYVFSKGFQPKYPDNKKFAVCLTHDIDVLFSTNTYRHLLKEVLMKENKREAVT